MSNTAPDSTGEETSAAVGIAPSSSVLTFSQQSSETSSQDLNSQGKISDKFSGFCWRFKMSLFVLFFLWHVLNSYAFRFCYCIINAVFRTKDCLFPEFSALKVVLPVFKFVCV